MKPLSEWLSHLEQAARVDFGHKFSREEQRGDDVGEEGDAAQERVQFERLGRVERHRQQAEQRAQPQRMLHPRLVDKDVIFIYVDPPCMTRRIVKIR